VTFESARHSQYLRAESSDSGSAAQAQALRRSVAHSWSSKTQRRLSAASESNARAGALASGSPSSTAARRLPEFAPDRRILGIYARTFQFVSVASGRDARKNPSRPLKTDSRARKIGTRALIVAFRRARFEIHASVDGGTRPWSGFATALEPKSRTRIRISTSG